MLHRVSTKKLRFRNRVNDFYRGYRIYGVRASMAGEALFPHHYERRRRVFEGARRVS